MCNAKESRPHYINGKTEGSSSDQSGWCDSVSWATCRMEESEAGVEVMLISICQAGKDKSLDQGIAISLEGHVQVMFMKEELGHSGNSLGGWVEV